jgi:methylmalonyl-CoA mutase N-terminal domain/subunit
MMAQSVPPAAIHRNTVTGCGPKTKTRAARVHTTTAALAMTSHDSSRRTARITAAGFPRAAS